MTPSDPIIITGANIGLGYDTARALLEINPHQALILAVRDIKRGQVAAQNLGRQTAASAIEVRALDLASLASIRRFVEDLTRRQVPKLAALICNAGLQTVRPATATSDGFETTFGVNHLGHFLLANLMLPLMADNGRILFVASGTHDPATKTGLPGPIWRHPSEFAKPDWGGEDSMTAGRRAYTTSKLCNIMTAFEMARRQTEAGSAITINAFDPGFMPGSGLARDYPLPIRLAWYGVLPVLRLVNRRMNSTRGSGRNLAQLATASDFKDITGQYFEKLRPIVASSLARDIENQAQLWAVSMQLTALT